MKNEEIIEAYEQLDELSKAVLASYIKKAEASKAGHLGSMNKSIEKSTTLRNAADDALKNKDLDTAFDAGEKAYDHEKDSMTSFKKSMTRSKGIGKAGARLTKESQELDESMAAYKKSLDTMKDWYDY